jgi:hypothetical protein
MYPGGPPDGGPPIKASLSKALFEMPVKVDASEVPAFANFKLMGCSLLACHIHPSTGLSNHEGIKAQARNTDNPKVRPGT